MLEGVIACGHCLKLRAYVEQKYSIHHLLVACEQIPQCRASEVAEYEVVPIYTAQPTPSRSMPERTQQSWDVDRHPDTTTTTTTSSSTSTSDSSPSKQAAGWFGPRQYAGDQPYSEGMHPYAQAGVSIGMAAIGGTILGTFIGHFSGRKRLYDMMLRQRIILIASTLGLYMGATGFVPPPPFLDTLTGRLPRPPVR